MAYQRCVSDLFKLLTNPYTLFIFYVHATHISSYSLMGKQRKNVDFGSIPIMRAGLVYQQTTVDWVGGKNTHQRASRAKLIVV